MSNSSGSDSELRGVDGSVAESPVQARVDRKNAAFWDELCGSTLAQVLGVVDDSPESLAKFDRWYFDFYPYLFRYIPFAKMRGKRVLEVGLGYGTVGERIAASGADYTGMDIAYNPSAMIRHRLAQTRLPGSAVQASILAAPLRDQRFDYVVSIGCLHHTGNLERAIQEVYRLLVPGGTAIIMVYSLYSYRRWAFWPRATWRHFLEEQLGLPGSLDASDEERRGYDMRTDGRAAPETAFTSRTQLRRMAKRFSDVRIEATNVAGEGVLRHFPRPTLNRLLGPLWGLDLYCTLRK